MTDQPVLPNFNSPETPKAVSITTAANVAAWLLLASKPARLLWAIVGLILPALVVTLPLREGRGWVVAIVSLAAFVGLLLGLGQVVAWIVGSQWFSSLLFGKPRFWPLESMGRRWFKTVLSTIGSAELQFAPDDRALLARVGAVTSDLNQELLRRRYVALYGEKGWEQTWASIQAVEVNGIKYGDALKSNLFDLFTLRYAGTRMMVLPCLVVYWGVFVWLLGGAATGDSYLRVSQWVFLAGCIIAGIIYTHFTILLRHVSFDAEASEEAFAEQTRQALDKDPILAEVIASFKERFDFLKDPDLKSRVARPAVRLKPEYTKHVRNHFMWVFLILNVVNAVSFLVPLALAWPLARLYSPWPSGQVNHYMSELAIGMALSPLAFCLAVGFALFIAESARALLNAIATAIFLATGPPLVNYVLGGDVGPDVIVSSVISGMAGFVSSAVVEMVKKRPSVDRVDETRPGDIVTPKPSAAS